LTSLRSAFASAPQTVAPVTDSTAKSGAPRETPATAAPKAAATAADSPRLAVTQKLHPSQLPPQELGLGAHLNAVVARVSGDLQKRAELLHVGLDDIPQQVTGPLKEALVQLVRNAVVHGLEVPAARTRAGKNELGKVTVTCQRDANGIEIRVEDDGLGISASRIRETAVARKLVTVEEAAQLQGGKLLGLLFKPGFSTAEPGNQHAGRGVGLDVVVDAIKRVGGRVGLSTKPGLGTKFTIRLPLADARHAA
jgi:chemotaxis protein histidine kinase CheA